MLCATLYDFTQDQILYQNTYSMIHHMVLNLHSFVQYS